MTAYIKIGIVMALLLMSACQAFSPKNVVFYENIEHHQSKYVDVFVDSVGDIYPNAGFPARPVLVGKPGNLTGSILNQAQHPGTDLCANPNTYKDTEAELLCLSLPQNHCDYLDRNSICTVPHEWISAQQQIWRNRAGEIYKQYKESGADDILFLVHGFNNTFYESSQWYQEEIIDRVNRLGYNPLIVRVFWDGFSEGVISGSWGMAQVSGPLVGFKMRQLFNALHANFAINDMQYPDIRVLTHSSGAFVTASTFGNMYTALPMMFDPERRQGRYRELVHYRADMTDAFYKIPDFDDLRIGMIASATATNTFTGVSSHSQSTDDEHEAGTLTSNTTLILTINWKDKVLNKYLGLEGVNLLGSTVSGTRRKEYCAFMEPLPLQKDNIKAVYGMDFRSGGFRNPHSVQGYFANEERASDFINLLFGKNVSDKYLIVC